ncbi:hypothetical protein CEQ20_09315 [Yersinia pseudotuberculosis]|nr:hypothetical protein CEQ20_09315 [Yersinia pseudotuberculosis]AYX13290.1 hypothetical protein EGX52_22355 [Yersinia pseudotuberculosis]MBO1548572.1 hypothetical protein [Yersinia pseudotuberculosis]MBO1554814.1 hypothetical protein [Yersinia pseudotuberculosis]MBO1563720.1 hypothetical protein [Yersinia pseudotuberculosis]
MDVFTASLRSACSLRRGHFVNNLINEIFFRFYSSPWTVKMVEIIRCKHDKNHNNYCFSNLVS